MLGIVGKKRDPRILDPKPFSAISLGKLWMRPKKEEGEKRVLTYFCSEIWKFRQVHQRKVQNKKQKKNVFFPPGTSGLVNFFSFFTLLEANYNSQSLQNILYQEILITIRKFWKVHLEIPAKVEKLGILIQKFWKIRKFSSIFRKLEVRLKKKVLTYFCSDIRKFWKVHQEMVTKLGNFICKKIGILIRKFWEVFFSENQEFSPQYKEIQR